MARADFSSGDSACLVVTEVWFKAADELDTTLTRFGVFGMIHNYLKLK